MFPQETYFGSMRSSKVNARFDAEIQGCENLKKEAHSVGETYMSTGLRRRTQDSMPRCFMIVFVIKSGIFELPLLVDVMTAVGAENKHGQNKND